MAKWSTDFFLFLWLLCFGFCRLSDEAFESDSVVSNWLQDVLKLLIVVAVSWRGKVDGGLELKSDENDIFAISQNLRFN